MTVFAPIKQLSPMWVGERSSEGGHQIWYSPAGARISIQNRGGMAKGYQVRQFLDYQRGEEK